MIFHQRAITRLRFHMTLQMANPKLHILAGIPGCGKSTFADRLDCPIVSSDGLREKLLHDVNSQANNDLVFRVFHNSLGWALREGYSVVADSTALDSRARKTLRDIAERHDAEAHLYLFDNTLEALMRNRRRDRVVPEDVMARMVSKYERTLIELPQEQYASVTRIGSFR